MTIAKTVAAIKRNTRVLGEIEEASDLRISYKTKDGWKRLRLPAKDVKNVRDGASRVVLNRLDKLVPSAVDFTVDTAMKTLVELLNE